mmetsp:Transcript_5005/g.13493  ORF Transcript_5005/g.13493 Transcript_5005/m.13493 type:complete len:148 (-) Transcript_5005:34-477(-)|eukprot:CAMPEP_0185833370 /NCGR_PEP_ID=MMETSP1353-20130828/2683_1 /TAXON_ID=1077150 /ORGANISM="Erythrolobus australicus, Strain CCMP3124" /LENGTH=147 /DNA_ID=CAMNT_0028531651 /DNA_START=80 /DNA_END=523 /DNA_ORIENTATION=-
MAGHFDEVEYVWNDKFCLGRENEVKRKLVRFGKSEESSKNGSATADNGGCRQSRLASLSLARWDSAPIDARSELDKQPQARPFDFRVLSRGGSAHRGKTKGIDFTSGFHGITGFKVKSEHADKRMRGINRNKSSSMNLSDYASSLSE